MPKRNIQGRNHLPLQYLTGGDFRIELQSEVVVVQRTSALTNRTSPYVPSIVGSANAAAIFAMVSSSARTSSALRSPTTSPDAILMPLLSASYIPRSFSLNVANRSVPSSEPPSMIRCSSSTPSGSFCRFTDSIASLIVEIEFQQAVMMVIFIDWNQVMRDSISNLVVIFNRRRLRRTQSLRPIQNIGDPRDKE